MVVSLPASPTPPPTATRAPRARARRRRDPRPGRRRRAADRCGRCGSTCAPATTRCTRAATGAEALDVGRRAPARPGHPRPRPARPGRHRGHRAACAAGPTCRSSCCPGAPTAPTRSRRSTPAPTTTSPSRSAMDELLARLRAADPPRGGPSDEQPVGQLRRRRPSTWPRDRVDRATGDATSASPPPSGTCSRSCVRHPGKLLSQRQLLTEVWGPGYETAHGQPAALHGAAAPQARARPGPAAAPAHRARHGLPLRALNARLVPPLAKEGTYDRWLRNSRLTSRLTGARLARVGPCCCPWSPARSWPAFPGQLTAATAVLILVLGWSRRPRTETGGRGPGGRLRGVWFDFFLTEPYQRFTITPRRYRGRRPAGG